MNTSALRRLDVRRFGRMKIKAQAMPPATALERKRPTDRMASGITDQNMSKEIKRGRKNGWQLPTNSVAVSRPTRRGQFYNGIEWLACWLLDNTEGETITEQQLRTWATEAWLQYANKMKHVFNPTKTRNSRGCAENSARYESSRTARR